MVGNGITPGGSKITVTGTSAGGADGSVVREFLGLDSSKNENDNFSLALQASADPTRRMVC